MLASEMSRQGTMLFRYRSFIPVILISPMLLAWATADSTSQTSPLALPWDCSCFLVSIAGLMLRVGTVGFVPAGTSGRNTAQQVANVLNTSGMNSTTRNPLYFGTFLMWLGMVMTTGNLLFLITFLLSFWLYDERIIAAEEEFLRGKFGAQFQTWAAVTPAFVPRLNRWHSPALRFSIRTVLKREYCGLLGLTSAFPLIVLSEHLFLEGRFFLEPFWMCVLGSGSSCFIILRSLKKHSILLSVSNC